jgi:16S rRNA (adenine1518-N6/adenine1519-N6)-dimethyltransferase
MSRPKLGQHWLVDKRVCKRIATAIALRHDETCIEIGGGRGALTRWLIGRPARLIVYELDPKWAAHLCEYGPAWLSKIEEHCQTDWGELREMDALRITWTREALKIGPDEKIVITGNIPYYITSPFFLNIAYSMIDIDRGVFLIQKEVAERISAGPGNTHYSRLSVSLGAFFEIETLFSVPKEAFSPKPKVTSAVVRFTRRPKPLVSPELVEKFELLVKDAFHMRRKTLVNNLAAAFKKLSKKDIENILSCMGVKPNARAQELKVQEFVTLTRMLNGD